MMRKMVRVLVLVLAMSLAICFTPCHGLAVDGPGWDNGTRRITPLKNFTDEFLNTHNRARAAVGVAPLKWSPSLAKSAADIAFSMISNDKGCHHNFDSRSLDQRHDYNLHWEPNQTPTPSEVVNKWVAMKKYYNYARNSCVRNSNCSTYTQVVWRKSLELGCALEACEHQPWVQPNGITLCLYSPPGNVPGERPY